MKQLPQVCQHAKRGICPACANPMRAPVARETHHITDFGKALLAALPAKRSKRRRNRRRNRANVNGPMRGRTYDAIILDDTNS